jgi:DNA (cytosine-5)-methyltransferase 1
MQTVSFIDMFSGAGLFSGGAAIAGMAPVFALDLSKDAVDSYNRNIAPVARVGSVLDVLELPAADVLLAGPPCQGFSTLGRRDPTDIRNDLALQVPRWAEMCGASVVVIENVPPFLQSRQWQLLAQTFKKMHYDVNVWELEATDFGSPQRRRRAFTVASRIGSLSRPHICARSLTAGDILRQPMAADDPLHSWPEPSELALRRFKLIPSGGDKRDIMRAAPQLCPPSWEKVGCNATDVWGRIDTSQPSNTIRCTFQNPSKGRYIHPTKNRVLSLREGARLQGVPDSWQFVGKPYSVARQIGNGVPLALSKAVTSSIMNQMLDARYKSLAA